MERGASKSKAASTSKKKSASPLVLDVGSIDIDDEQDLQLPDMREDAYECWSWEPPTSTGALFGESALPGLANNLERKGEAACEARLNGNSGNCEAW